MSRPPRKPPHVALTPQLLISAYSAGVFPMAETRDSAGVFWVEPHLRGIIPLDRFHVSRSLAKTIRRGDFAVRVDTAFRQTMAGCAGRADTWINDAILEGYCALHAEGRAHSIEVWRDGALIGGLYGVRIGAAFFGESMFSRARDASKIAITYTVARLNAGGFRLFDTQFTTPHLMRFGGIELDRETYRKRLAAAIDARADFGQLTTDASPEEVLHAATQTS